MIGIIAEFNIKEGKAEEFLSEAGPLVKGSNQEAGCLRYELHKDLDHENKFFMIEEWKDQGAVDFHNSTEHFTTILPRLSALLSESPRVSLLNKVL